MWAAKSAAQTIAVVLLLAVLFMAGRYYRTASSTELDDEVVFINLDREAEVLNATLPEMVSEGVRLDKVTAGPGNVFNYIYTIVSEETAKNLVGNSNKLADLRAQLHERVCSMMPAYRENGTVVSYSLKDNNGAAIAEVSINPRDC
jgi:hypothetical protein